MSWSTENPGVCISSSSTAIASACVSSVMRSRQATSASPRGGEVAAAMEEDDDEEDEDEDAKRAVSPEKSRPRRLVLLPLWPSSCFVCLMILSWGWWVGGWVGGRRVVRRRRMRVRPGVRQCASSQKARRHAPKLPPTRGGRGRRRRARQEPRPLRPSV